MKIFNLIKTTSLKALATLSLCSLLVCGEIGCTTSWIQEAEQIAPVAVSSVTSILELIAAFQGNTVSASDLNTVTSISNQVNKDLNLASTLVAGYNAANAVTTEQQINAALSDAETNLSSILTSLHITDTATQAKITALVNLVQSQITAWENLLPSKGVTAKLAAKPLSKKEYEKKFNSILKSKTGNATVDAATAKVHKI